jgi:hypothetical protein
LTPIFFTDGANTYSWLREEQVVFVASRSNPVLYAITRNETKPPLDLGTARAQESLLTFRHREPVQSGCHDLEVKVKRKGVEVQAGRGYNYEPAR